MARRKSNPKKRSLARHQSSKDAKSPFSESAIAELETQIQSHVSTCFAIVPQHDPRWLLKRAYDDRFRIALGKTKESDVGHAELMAVKVLEYLQSAIVSAPAAPPSSPPPDEDAWQRLKKSVHAIYESLIPWIVGSHATNPPRSSVENIDLSHALVMDWVFIRGNRYSVHERPRLTALLEPHDDKLAEIFKSDAEGIGNAVESTLVDLSKGTGINLAEMQRLCALVNTDPRDLFSSESTSPVDIEAKFRAVDKLDEFRQCFDNIYGFGLFDITSKFSVELLENLSLEPGSDNSFCTNGNYRGWPVRPSPWTFKPFLKIGSRYYVFNPYNLDPLYRAIERSIRTVDPDYQTTWGERQKEATEALPTTLLKRFLPSAAVYTEVYYRDRTEGKSKWAECDAVLTLDDLLLVVEVKAGKVTPTSPLDDLQAYEKNIKQLLMSPARQADRFVQNLKLDTCIKLHDQKHSIICELKREDFSRVVCCAVMVDSLAAVSGHFQHLPVGTDTPTSWCISLDELYIYADVLSGPTAFYHFLQQRLRAFQLPQIRNWDEADHLGMYLHNNAYADWVAAQKAGRVGVGGFRDSLDQYFAERWEGKEPSPPAQMVPRTLASIIERLEESRRPGHLRAGAAILDLNGDARNRLAAAIEESFIRVKESVRPLFIRVPNKRSSLFLVCLPEHHEMDEDARKQVRAQLLLEGLHRADVVYVSSQPSALGISRAGCEPLLLGTLSPSEEAELRSIADVVQTRRFIQAHEPGTKIGRNDKCPCGSGKKFKKCCVGKHSGRAP